jgi:DNA-binding transcriptional LysR family regulator
MVAMTNIPTELLRTLVRVVELRSFTKAAGILGITQPAVSAQIKRLQAMLGSELLDKRAPGVTLTRDGERVVEAARRLLAINDRIVEATANGVSAPTLRVGIAPTLGPDLMPLLRLFVPPQDWRLEIRRDASDRLLNDLAEQELDLVVALSIGEPYQHARFTWPEPLAWVRGQRAVEVSHAVPLIACEAKLELTRAAISVLEQEGRPWKVACKVADDASLTVAIVAGLGVAVAATRFVPPAVSVWTDAPLPKLPDLCGAVYLRAGPGSTMAEEIATAIALAMQSRTPRAFKSSAPLEVAAWREAATTS